MNKATVRSLLLGLFVLSSLACDGPKREDAGVARSERSGPPVVLTTIEANRYFAARVGGEQVDVRSPVPSAADPLTWEPGRDAIAALQAADLVLLNGAGLETWRDRITLRPSATIELAEAYTEQWLTFEGSVEHQHGPEGSHTHSGTDPHVWLDPTLAKKHVEQIVAALAELSPEHAAEFRTRGDALLADLADLDTQFRGEKGTIIPAFLANHPAYDYAARRYGWSIENHDLDPESDLEASVAAELARAGAKILLWESAPTAATESVLRAVGITSVVISPCEQTPASGDWLTVMRENARKLQGLRKKP